MIKPESNLYVKCQKSVMKRIIAMLCFISVVLSLSACSSSADDTMPDDTGMSSIAYSDETTSDDFEIATVEAETSLTSYSDDTSLNTTDITSTAAKSETENEVVLLNDEVIKVVYMSFYEVEGIEDTTYLQLHVENKTDSEITVYATDCYVNNTQTSIGSGVPMKIASGKNSENAFIIFTDYESIESIELRLKIVDENLSEIEITDSLLIPVIASDYIDTTSATENTNADNEIVLLDDEIVRVAYMSFYEVEGLEGTTYLQLHVENKTDFEITVYATDCYVNNTQTSIGSGVPMKIASGKNSENAFIISSDYGSIESIELQLMIVDENFSEIETTNSLIIPVS